MSEITLRLWIRTDTTISIAEAILLVEDAIMNHDPFPYFTINRVRVELIKSLNTKP